jgi:hypothetical protein
LETVVMDTPSSPAIRFMVVLAMLVQRSYVRIEL